MGFNQDVANSYKVMSENIAKAQMVVNTARLKAAEMRLKDMQENVSQDSQIFGKFVVNGAGEYKKVINFPVSFTKPPAVLTTVEVQPQQELIYASDVPALSVERTTALVDGKAPLAQANIIGWITEDHPPLDSYYTGVEILTICEGVRGVKFIVHWSAAGTAYMNPSGGNMADDFKTAIQLGQLYGQGMQ